MNTRHSFLLLTVLTASPLLAQGRLIAPAPSVLFRAAPPEPVQDTVKVDDGIPQNEGGFLGFLAGGGIGYLITQVHLSGGDPTCDVASPGCGTPSKKSPEGKVVMTAVGALTGMFIGSHLARPRAPKVKTVAPPPPPRLTPSPHMDTGMTRRQGANIGGLAGGVAGVAMAARFGWKVDADAGGGVDPISLATYGAVGALIGMLVGGGMAGSR